MTRMRELTPAKPPHSNPLPVGARATTGGLRAALSAARWRTASPSPPRGEGARRADEGAIPRGEGARRADEGAIPRGEGARRADEGVFHRGLRQGRPES